MLQRLWVVGSLVLLGLVSAAVPPAHAGGSELTFTATIDGRDLASIDGNAPLELVPSHPTVVSVRVTNTGTSEVSVRRVRLQARVVGLTLFNYTTPVNLVVEPGATEESSFTLDLTDLGDQATGLLPARVSLLAPDRSELAGRKLVVDVRGSIRSVYGTFALGVAAMTVTLFLSLFVRLVTGRLPNRRWKRGWRFAVPGLGAGLTLTFTLSALRIAVPSPSLSLSVLLAGGLVGGVIGLLTPGRKDNEVRDVVYRGDLLDLSAADCTQSSEFGRAVAAQWEATGGWESSTPDLEGAEPVSP